MPSTQPHNRNPALISKLGIYRNKKNSEKVTKKTKKTNFFPSASARRTGFSPGILDSYSTTSVCYFQVRFNMISFLLFELGSAPSALFNGLTLVDLCLKLNGGSLNC